MATITQRKTSTNEAGSIRRIIDHPKWQAALEVRRLLEIEAAKAEEEVRKMEGVRPTTPRQSKIAFLVKKLLAKVSGQPEPPPEPDPATIWENDEAAKNALAEIKTKNELLKSELRLEIREAWEPEFFQDKKELFEAVIVVKIKWDKVRAKAHKMAHPEVGALNNGTFGHYEMVNFSNCGGFPRVLDGMSLPAFREANRNFLT
ncbi:MAG: hypothetical protein ABSG67_22110 [Thermoguttaceae bacterium]|jgi:hypothetical protein